ncbi:haloacid dehalogenase type II [Prauserella cavernicola]|uniref:Haloacid dehalogenase type II n=1 Tax=Prauserella cavernicola TaxID=2800127 RepID=A0A934V2W7_9PSEU|nr:haloacid dehalogenase type II [Prauserella cavernicola]MBK1783612.1 haloacid dehalogenase type II [Prauserella cavernicola]
MTTAQPGPRVEAVLFDTFGTVVDWRAGVAAAVDSFAERHGLDLDGQDFALRWRARYQPSMEPVRTGAREFVSLDVLHRENLLEVLGEHGIDAGTIEPGELTWLVEAWHRLPPWPDSVTGLRRLRERALIGPLSNGNLALLARMAKNAGLPWDVVLGSDVTRAYKPQPESYLRAVSLLGLEPGEVMLAAAHNSDLHAAASAGLRTAFVARPSEFGPGQTTDLEPAGDWDLVAGDLVELADRFTGPAWSVDRRGR